MGQRHSVCPRCQYCKADCWCAGAGDCECELEDDFDADELGIDPEEEFE
jgi:hypothetical protein